MTVSLPPRRLTLPPPYSQHRLDGGDVLDAAVARAPDEGAGTLVWQWLDGAGAPGRLDFAVVLEPDMPLADARLAFAAGMVATCEALAAHCPPERPLRIRWPSEIRFDTTRLGGARMAVSPGTDEADTPDWIVFAVELIGDRDHLEAPGAFPDSISLREEEFLDPPAIVESFAAHLMLFFDRWKHDGPQAIAARYAQRLEEGGTITDEGDLLRDGARHALRLALERADWRDDRGPRL
jgi:biotin-(acetyl-CoA carboxylase) ligase